MNNHQKRALKAKAHALKPVVIIGQMGLTEAVQQEIQVHLDAHELIKIRVPQMDKSDTSSMIEAICAYHSAEFIQHIGHVVVIYRQRTDHT